MNLYILRHASAGVRRPNPLVDVRRPLDKEGKQQCLQLAHVLNALKVNFDLVVSSPLKRALQTAQLVATETGYEAEILQAGELAPTAVYADFLQLVHQVSDRENVLMVGHSPNLPIFAGLLLCNAKGSQPIAAVPQVRLRKGSLARFTVSRGKVSLQSLIEPRLVRALYSTSTKSSRRKTSRK